MCELFCISSKTKVKINDYLNAFYGHCEEHPHGWGLAVIDENKYDVYKESIKASESEKLKCILSKPLIVEEAFAHIRFATIGNTNILNCHPFSRQDNYNNQWILMHNGTIFRYDKLDYYVQLQEGQTDSERILLYILDVINDFQNQYERSLTWEECFNVLDSIIKDLSKGNKLNIMICTRGHIYAHTNCSKALHYLEDKSTIIISNQPLSEDKWIELPINQLFVLNNGKIVLKGSVHENEYIFTKKHLEYLLGQLTPEERENTLKEYGDIDSLFEYINTKKYGN